MIFILIFVVACGAIPLRKSESQDHKAVLLQNDSNLEIKGIHSEDDEYRIAGGSLSAVHSFLVNLGSEGKVRRKRFIARSGMCPDNQVMMPRPIGCISCEEYKDITGRDC